MPIIQQFLEKEKQLGITKDNFNKKFVFHYLKDLFLTSKSTMLEQLNPEGHDNIYLPRDQMSPSQREGLNQNHEIKLRMHGAQMIYQAGIMLKLPVTTTITALMIFQRFFSKNSFYNHDYREICMGAVFLSGKVDETFKKIMDVAYAFISIFRVYDPDPVNFQNRELTQKIREIIVSQERLILKEMGFELFRFSDQPHKFIGSFFNFLKIPKQVVQVVWGHLNDAYLTDLCVYYPPQVISAGCLYLAMRQLNIPMPNQPWWILLEANLEQIQDVASTILQLNEISEKLEFRKVKQMLPTFRESYIDNSFLIKPHFRQVNMELQEDPQKQLVRTQQNQNPQHKCIKVKFQNQIKEKEQCEKDKEKETQKAKDQNSEIVKENQKSSEKDFQNGSMDTEKEKTKESTTSQIKTQEQFIQPAPSKKREKSSEKESEKKHDSKRHKHKKTKHRYQCEDIIFKRKHSYENSKSKSKQKKNKDKKKKHGRSRSKPKSRKQSREKDNKKKEKEKKISESQIEIENESRSIQIKPSVEKQVMKSESPLQNSIDLKLNFDDQKQNETIAKPEEVVQRQQQSQPKIVLDKRMEIEKIRNLINAGKQKTEMITSKVAIEAQEQQKQKEIDQKQEQNEEENKLLELKKRSKRKIKIVQQFLKQLILQFQRRNQPQKIILLNPIHQKTNSLNIAFSELIYNILLLNYYQHLIKMDNRESIKATILEQSIIDNTLQEISIGSQSLRIQCWLKTYNVIFTLNNLDNALDGEIPIPLPMKIRAQQYPSFYNKTLHVYFSRYSPPPFTGQNIWLQYQEYRIPHNLPFWVFFNLFDIQSQQQISITVNYRRNKNIYFLQDDQTDILKHPYYFNLKKSLQCRYKSKGITQILSQIEFEKTKEMFEIYKQQQSNQENCIKFYSYFDKMFPIKLIKSHPNLSIPFRIIMRNNELDKFDSIIKIEQSFTINDQTDKLGQLLIQLYPKIINFSENDGFTYQESFDKIVRFTFFDNEISLNSPMSFFFFEMTQPDGFIYLVMKIL